MATREDLYLEQGINFATRSLYLSGEITADKIDVLIRAIELLENKSHDPIKLTINSGGGETNAGFALYDRIKASPCEFTTVGIGEVSSMATVVILAASKRYCYPNTSFMWHSVSADAGNGSAKHFEAHVEASDMARVNQMMFEVYAKETKRNKKYYEKWLKYEDQYGGAHLAKTLGFVTKIL